MADIKSAAAHSVLPASLTHVDHRRPYHDQFCRCRACKPPRAPRRPRGSDARRRVWVAALALLGTFWAVALYGALGGHA